MSQNRVLFVLIVAALLAATAVSLRQVMITNAAGNSGSIDSATRSYMAWAKAVEEQQKLAAAKIDRSFHTPQTSNYRSAQGSIQCLDNECTYQLPDGRWGK